MSERARIEAEVAEKATAYRRLLREGFTHDAQALRRVTVARYSDAATIPTDTVTGLQEHISISPRDVVRRCFEVAATMEGDPLC